VQKRLQKKLFEDMKIISLISGGKDSIFSLMHCKSLGHEIKVLANLYPARKEGGDSGQELDSWMFQSIGAELIPLLAECIGLPLFRRPIRGKSRNVC
jgi:diphthine-ammonia ligase